MLTGVATPYFQNGNVSLASMVIIFHIPSAVNEVWRWKNWYSGQEGSGHRSAGVEQRRPRDEDHQDGEQAEEPRPAHLAHLLQQPLGRPLQPQPRPAAAVHQRVPLLKLETKVRKDFEISEKVPTRA